MKLFIKHILLFGLLFFIVEKGLYYFIQNAPKKEYDKRLELILEGKMEKDIVIIGSSRGANNVSAKQLEEKTGFSCYNLSYRGSSVIFHEFILKTLLLHNNKPKKVLLVIDNGYQFIKEHSLHFRFDRLNPLKNYGYIHEKLIENNKKSFLSNFFYSFKVNREDFSLKPKRIYEIDVMTSHGSKLLKAKNNEKLEYINEVKKYEINEEELAKLEAFNSIQRMCSNNDIELYLVFTPGLMTFDTDFLKRFKKLVSPDEKIIVYDTLDERYKEKDIYRDHTHMFSKGAKIFTSEISDFINSNK
ncbi:hypothetical protein [Olleya sp. UBA1516]|uniref:hypothetical protein n=1 Tax=Olleya sp. UBA1516 TaxID=1947013 RepID=UPI0025F6C7E3|nr:hypothetical protein [Olleya sp. UBA1516]|tara:strand:+ start:1030 stop:1932 length:903 start_codon:yes stop_codon:yes gene_type:complete